MIVLLVILIFCAVGAFVHTKIIMPREEERRLSREHLMRELERNVRRGR